MSRDVEDPVTPRKTLKLKAALSRAAPMAKPQLKPDAKPSTGPKTPHDWAAEHKRRMQADMDALSDKGKR